MHNKVAILFGLAAMATSGSALAQEFGKKMDLVFSADRLFAFHNSHRTVEYPAPVGDRDASSTGFSFGWRGNSGMTAFDVPRLAFDIFVIDSLSVGGAIGYVNYDNNEDQGQGGAGWTDQDHNQFIFSPRVGYVWMFTPGVGFWLRGGFTYHAGDFGPWTNNGFALTVEPAFVFSPADHFAFLAAPYGDFDLFGNTHEDDPNGADWDTRERSIGVFASLLGWF
jgi:hypothetical protein